MVWTLSINLIRIDLQATPSNEKSSSEYYTHKNAEIDPMENYRKILGITKDATQEDLKRHYRALVKQYHPDKNQNSMSNVKFKQIVDAYEHLATK